MILQGDALTQLRTLESDSIDCIVTSPPYYNVRDYGVDGQIGLEKTPQEYIQNLMNVFLECKRALKKTGSIWVNIGDSYGNAKCETNLKNNHGFLPRAETKVFNKSLIGIPERFSLAMTDRLGLIRRNTIIWHKPNAMPSSAKDRFTIDFEYFYFFTKSQKYYFETQYEPHKNPQDSIRRLLKNKSYTNNKVNNRYFGTSQLNCKKSKQELEEQFSKGRIKRCVWRIATQSFKDAHFAVFPEKLVETPIRACCPSEICIKCKKPRVKILEHDGYISYGNPVKNPKYLGLPLTNYHSSPDTCSLITKQVKRYMEQGLSNCGCNAGFEAGTVLDPFCGAGTTLLVAKKLHRKYIGIEINPEYIQIANKRLSGIL